MKTHTPFPVRESASKSSRSPLERINLLFNDYRLRRFFLRLRAPLIAAAVLSALSLVPRSPWFWAGLLVSLAGAAAQWWCFACIMTSKELAANGPYRFVRNPMYLSRYFLVLGMFLMLDPTLPWRWLGPVAFTMFYGFFMVNRVAREERKLRAIFGEPYAAYLRAVPRFVPALRPRVAGRTLYWCPVAFKRNNGARNMLIVLAGYGLACALTYGGGCASMYRGLIPESNCALTHCR